MKDAKYNNSFKLRFSISSFKGIVTPIKLPSFVINILSLFCK